MKNIYNFILFQALWLYTVLGVAKNNLWPAIIIFSGFAILFLFSDYSHKTDKKLFVFCIFTGSIVDSILAKSRLVEYQQNIGYENIAPYWILLLWGGFALTLNHSMSWMLRKPKVAYSFITIGAPLSYFSASKLGAVDIPNMLNAFLMISLLWLITYHSIVLFQSHFSEAKVKCNDLS